MRGNLGASLKLSPSLTTSDHRYPLLLKRVLVCRNRNRPLYLSPITPVHTLLATPVSDALQYTCLKRRPVPVARLCVETRYFVPPLLSAITTPLDAFYYTGLSLMQEAQTSEWHPPCSNPAGPIIRVVEM